MESITERQDICLNITKMSDEEIMKEIKIGAKQLNDMLDLGLNEDTYIKTKGYKNAKIKNKPIDDPENMEIIDNDVSFNYATTQFEFQS